MRRRWMATLMAGGLLLAAAFPGASAPARAAEGVLAPGARGPEVRRLQQYLVSLGFDLTQDGVYGRQTAAAVRKVQQAFGLHVDGTVGPQTRELLDRLVLRYTVRPGDTLYDLARLLGVTVERLMETNGLARSLLVPGDVLLLPQPRLPSSEPVYVIQKGDTLWEIAYEHGTTVEALMALNGIDDPHRLRLGSRLLLPPAGGGDEDGDPRGGEEDLSEAARARLAWPARGTLTSPYGWRIHPIYRTRHFHAGIDIALPVGTPVRAAADGRVERAGWMGEYGYGVVIEHPGGLETYYGHLSKISVGRGERVARGQVIALSGNTGTSTGPHLDFRVKVHDETVDPLALLP